MTTAAAEDDLQFRRRKRRTRWIAALLEGGAAAIFIAILSSESLLAAIAFGAIGLAAFLLWPITVQGRNFPLWRLCAFGVLVIFLGACLGFLVFLIPGSFHLSHVSLLGLLRQILEWSALTTLVFGIVAIPAAIVIARLAVILGNPQLDPK